MLKIAIIEDNKAEADRLREFLDRFSQQGSTTLCVDVFGEALSFLEHYKPVYDIVFMDIEMPYLDGMEAARRLREVAQKILLIFVTNMAQFAVKGYDELKHSYLSVSLTGIGMLLCTDLLQSLYDGYAAVLPAEVNTLMNVPSIVTCLFLLAFLCASAERSEAEQSAAVLKHMLHQQKEQLAASKETIELINIKCHDVKSQLAMLGDRVLPETINDLNRTLTIYDGVPHTGSEALDVLLAEKTLQCQRKEIRFDYMADGGCLPFLSPADVYSLVGNALNNAVDAAAQCPDRDKRYIKLRISVEKGMVMLHLENRYSGMLDFDSDLPRTTKRSGTTALV